MLIVTGPTHEVMLELQGTWVLCSTTPKYTHLVTAEACDEGLNWLEHLMPSLVLGHPSKQAEEYFICNRKSFERNSSSTLQNALDYLSLKAFHLAWNPNKS